MDQDGSATGVYGQLFSENGTKIGIEFQVNTYIDSSQMRPSIASFSNSNFVVTWQSFGQDSQNSQGIFGQLFDSNCSKIGNEFQVNSNKNKDQSYPSVTSLSNGNFVVTWTTLSQDIANTDGIFGQLFDNNTSPIGSEFQVNTYSNDDQQFPSVASLNNGNFVVTWQSMHQDNSWEGIFGQLFDENATATRNEFQVNTYSNNGQQFPSVASLNNGNFVVTWHSYGQDGSAQGIFGQLFDGNGTKIGSEFRANSYITFDQKNPSVASLNNGNFVVTWQSVHQDNSWEGIFGQLFNDLVVTSSTFTSSSYTTSTISTITFASSTRSTSLTTSSTLASLSTSTTFIISSTGTPTLANSTRSTSPITSFTLASPSTSTTFIISSTGTPTLANSTRSTSPITSFTLASPSTSTTFIISSTGTPTLASSTRSTSLITSSTLASPSTSTTFIISSTDAPTLISSARLTNPVISSILTTATSTNLKASSPKKSRSILWISLGMGGLFCFCVTPLGFLLLRRRKSQIEARFSEETGASSTTFELKPVVQRAHKVIGEAYLQLSTLVREEAEEIYLQTGHLIPFPEGQKKFPYVIGSGQFGKIKVAQRIADGLYVASKKVKGAENMRASEAEAQIQQAASGDNVLPIFNTIRLEDALYHFMPLAGLGDGATIQRRLAILDQSPLAITILQFIALNILTGLQTIHAKGIYHLDMKPDNLVFTKDGTAYITDFGCAQRPESRHLPGKALGDNRYFSPERLRACQEGTFYAEKADMWAAGVALLQIFYNKDPLELFNLPQRLAARVERCDQAHFDKQLQQLFGKVEKGSIWWVIKGLLDTNPKTRFTAREALQARCFHGLDKIQQERNFEELRRETFAQHERIEKSEVNLGDYGWVMQRVPEEERGQGYRSEQNKQFYGYSLTPDFVPPNYQHIPDHVTASSATSGHQLTP